MKFFVLPFIFLVSFSINSQSWCSEKYNPATNVKGFHKSIDYKKKYTFYFYFQQKSGKDTFFTPIYKLSFLDYNNNTNDIFKFRNRFNNYSRKFIKDNYPNFYMPSNYTNSVKYCLNLKDLEKKYSNQIRKVKKTSLAIVLNELNFESFIYKSSGKNPIEQKLSFILVE